MNNKSVYMIGVAGGTASGKTSVCKIISDKLSKNRSIKILVLGMDNYYLDVDDRENIHLHNFDHPNSLDIDSTYRVLKALKNRKPAKSPIYDMINQKRSGYEEIQPVDCIIFEGILALYDERIRNLLDLAIYVDTPSDVRVLRRIKRDMKDRKRDISKIIDQFERHVVPSHEQFVEPTKKYANIIIPTGKTNVKAIDLIVGCVRRILCKDKK